MAVTNDTNITKDQQEAAACTSTSVSIANTSSKEELTIAPAVPDQVAQVMLLLHARQPYRISLLRPEMVMELRKMAIQIIINN